MVGHGCTELAAFVEGNITKMGQPMPATNTATPLQPSVPVSAVQDPTPAAQLPPTHLGTDTPILERVPSATPGRLSTVPSKPPSAGKRPASASASGENKTCNCRNSKCLKLYCECFASGRYCSGCNCANCMNNTAHEAARSKAIEAILERNPNAFRPKIQFQPVRVSGRSTYAAIPGLTCRCMLLLGPRHAVLQK